MLIKATGKIDFNYDDRDLDAIAAQHEESHGEFPSDLQLRALVIQNAKTRIAISPTRLQLSAHRSEEAGAW